MSVPRPTGHPIPRRTGLRAGLTAAAVALLAVTGTGTASAQSADPTDGGRTGGGSSQLTVPQGVAIGSVGGPELTQVDSLDPARFAGKWYQVAAVPQPFTVQCVRDTTAEYAVLDAQTISVRNSCTTPWGAPSGIEGTARVTDPVTRASLRVTFPGVPFQDPNGAPNYRVTHLADDYSLAVVGDPSRLSGFVLSRTPGLTPEQWTQVRGVVADRGWWPCAFLTTPQAGGRGDVAPLCTV